MTLLMFAAPLSADDKPAQTSAPPAAANATAEVPAPPPEVKSPDESPSTPKPGQSAPGSSATTPKPGQSVPGSSATTPKPGQSESFPGASAALGSAAEAPETPVTPTVLEQRVNALLKDPGPMIDREAVRNQLDLLTDTASQLALMSDDSQVRFDALNVQLQSIYTRLIEYPDSPDVDHLLGRLRAAARRIKAIDLPGELPGAGSELPGAVGDFWLLTAELYDMNRMKLPLEARRQQAAGLMKDFLAKHADWPAAMDVREAMEQVGSAAPSPSRP
ncbi:MAG: hypothetical protein ACYC26_10010 [Phycisphaerales bacterium]